MVSMWKVRELVDKATNIVMNYTEVEAKVYVFCMLMVHFIKYIYSGSRGHQ